MHDDGKDNDRREQAWLDAAYEQAHQSWEQGGLPIGAVLVDAAGQIIARGHNEREQSGDPTAHAEIACIRNAGRRRDWSTMTLVTTLSPCPMCSGSAILFRIGRIIIGENQTFMGAEDWLRHSGVELSVLNDTRCIELMQRAQAERPELWAEDIGK